MIQSRLFILRDNGRIPNGFFCSLEGHIGKGTPFVGMFQMKVNNLSPSRSPLAKGTCNGHFTEPPAFWGFTFLKALTICVCVTWSAISAGLWRAFKTTSLLRWSNLMKKLLRLSMKEAFGGHHSDRIFPVVSS